MISESLHGQWGVLDINDAHQSVIELDKLGLVDKNRAVIHGGSAGGYAVLQIATSLPTAFAAGSPQYGISDMKKLDEILHKFEYYLCDRLMGGTYEEIPEIWKERSPIYHVHKIKMPMLVSLFVCLNHHLLTGTNVLHGTVFARKSGYHYPSTSNDRDSRHHTNKRSDHGTGSFRW